MSESIIENPTYMGEIRHFFEEIDLSHMKAKNIDLSTYESLVAQSTDVFLQTQPPNANMPPSAARKWSESRSQTFKNWILNGHPRGEPTPVQPSTQEDAPRTRKDVDSLSPQELATLKSAFEGLMNKEHTDPDSYFALAGLHWYPSPNFCKHHENRYNPWHRAYLIRFEDAMRQVPGCDDVTLPWWDITKAPPSWLFEAPFADYTLPINIHPSYPKGTTTKRNSLESIAQNVASLDLQGTIADALGRSSWESFVSYTTNGIEGAHDTGHTICGPTLSSPDMASFDPIFWFFHSNWDRLWWRWQQIMGATTYWTFRSTVTGPTEFLEAPFDELKPFQMKVRDTIDSHAMGITYAQPPNGGATASISPIKHGNKLASSAFRMATITKASVRVKGIDRLSIPGSFRVVLLANDQTVATRHFFQSKEPNGCEGCRKRGTISLDFRVPLNSITEKELAVKVEVIDPEPGLSPRFPLHACGNPTLNVRVLLEDG